MRRQVHQLRIVLTEVVPPVWRRVLLPSGFTLDRVHRAIQLAMGWQDSHLHAFDIAERTYGPPDPVGELEIEDELETRLDQVTGKGDLFRYTYDFGDWWEHEVTVEDVLGADLTQRYPICLAGAGACPPEDVGGASGYRELRAALADPAHPRHRELTGWLGRPFDPDAFDPARVTTLLRRLA